MFIIYFKFIEQKKTDEVVLQYENFDLTNIKTPVNVGMLEKLLTDSHYDKKETKFLIDGFTNGFSIGYMGPEDINITSPKSEVLGCWQ